MYLVVGIGTSGIETARYLQRHNMAFHAYDQKQPQSVLAGEIGESGYAYFNQMPQLNGYEAIILSPGIPITHPVIAEARHLNIPVMSEVEFAFRQTRGRVIGVTGSNGKSTTVSLIHHLLVENGLNASLCGNIGVPFISCATQDPHQIHVVEISSFQMEHVQTFCPEVGLLLNISPDHLDRHGSMAAYEEAKLRMFANQQPHHLAYCDPTYLDRLPGQARKYPVPGAKMHVSGAAIIAQDMGSIDSAHLPLLGYHNRLNALFAALAASHFGVSFPDSAKAMQSFTGLPHRMEKVGAHQGRLWINDSKATNTHATQAAVSSMEQGYVLILGGCDKGERFGVLDFSIHPPKAVVAYGETAPLIMEDLKHLSPVHVPQFKQACLKAHELAEPGDAVLQAPACASFDQFKNYMARGDAFKAIYRELAGLS